MLKRTMGVLTLAAVVACAILLAIWYLPLTNDDTIRIEIRPGQTVNALASEWEKEGWLPSALLLRAQARFYGNARSLRAGEYDIPPGLNSAQLLPFLATATPVGYRITLVEGLPLREVLKTLAAESRLQQDIVPLNPKAVAEYLKLDAAEGWLYPDTYVFQRGDKVSSILNQAHQRMQKNLDEAWQNRAENLPYKTPYEALIMASIVEKETGVEYERPMIAGVFVRRLNNNMRLETDPTVIYGIENFDGNLRRKHLLDRSNVWNTYRHKGLPPTPIALAGRKALEAALHPADGDELFFVARGDGSHVFSATLAEHNKAVREYQIRNRPANYRSAPPVETKSGATKDVL